MKDKLFGIYNAFLNKHLNNPIYFKSIYGPLKGTYICMAPKHGLKKILGTYEPDIARVIQNNVDSGNTCIDVGSHIGYFTLYMRKLVGDNGRVFAFEPLKEGCELTNKSIEKNKYTNVTALQLGLAEQDTTRDAHVFDDSSMANFLDSGFVTYSEKNVHKIKLAKLDTIYGENKADSLDFIKIDVEGYELNVIKGGIETIKRFKPKMLIEIHNLNNFKELYNILCKLEYSFEYLSGKPLNPDDIPQKIFHVLVKV